MSRPLLDSDLRLVVTTGCGLVGRTAHVIVVIPDVSPEQAASADQLLARCLSAEPSRSKALLRQVAFMLGEPEADDPPGFCLLVARDADQLTMFAYGAVEVTLPGSSEPLSAADHLTWIERSLTSLAGFAVTAAGARAQSPTSDSLDLRAGVVPGSGIWIVPAGQTGSTADPAAPEALPSPEPPEPPVPEPKARQTLRRATLPPPSPDTAPTAEALSLTFEAVSLVPAADSTPAPPLPTVEEGVPDEGGVLVKGIVCSRGHFNDPGSAYCGACGISMLQRTHEFVSAPRPPLGVLILDEGSVFSVDGDYVLGREPELDRSVVTGRARPLVLDDPDGAVSRVHAELRLDGWTVLLEDRGSSNGTFYAVDAQSEWIRLLPGNSQALAPGHRIRLGRRTAVFDSHVRPR